MGTQALQELELLKGSSRPLAAAVPAQAALSIEPIIERGARKETVCPGILNEGRFGVCEKSKQPYVPLEWQTF